MAALVAATSLGLSSGWAAAARAKQASLQSVANSLTIFAAVAQNDAAPEAEQWAYAPLTVEEGAASCWSALDDHYDPESVSLSEEAYVDMTEDENRTPHFAAAIRARLAQAAPHTLTVLDIGTGPFALLALLAAEAGAKRVYALEVSPDACQRARQAVEEAGYADVIEVIEGFSTSLELPTKVDVVVSEIVGSIASDEGLYATIKDAHARFVHEPTSPDSWIPHRVETWGAPCSYALQYALGPPQYDWGALEEPIRLSCLDETLRPLATPQCLERIDFTDAHLPPSAQAAGPAPVDADFLVSESTLAANEQAYGAALSARGVHAEAATRHARAAARSLSGLAMWPRLVLRDGGQRGDGTPCEEQIIVETRGAGAGGASMAPGRSAWQTVVPLLADRPVTVEAGQLIRTRFSVELPHVNDDPVWYSVEYT